MLGNFMKSRANLTSGHLQISGRGKLSHFSQIISLLWRNQNLATSCGILCSLGVFFFSNGDPKWTSVFFLIFKCDFWRLAWVQTPAALLPWTRTFLNSKRTVEITFIRTFIVGGSYFWDSWVYLKICLSMWKSTFFCLRRLYIEHILKRVSSETVQKGLWAFSYVAFIFRSSKRWVVKLKTLQSLL